MTDEAVSLESEPFTEPIDVHTMSDTKDEQIKIARDDGGLEITVESPPPNRSEFEDEPVVPNKTHVQEIVRANETVQSLIHNSSEHDVSTRVAVDLSYKDGRELQSVERDQTAFEVITTSETEVRMRQTASSDPDAVTATLILREEGHETTYTVTVDAMTETVTDITAAST